MVKGTIGYFVYIIPTIILGLTLSSLNIINRLEKHKNKTIMFLIIIILILYLNMIFL